MPLSCDFLIATRTFALDHVTPLVGLEQPLYIMIYALINMKRLRGYRLLRAGLLKP